jgi:hypothetical protein
MSEGNASPYPSDSPDRGPVDDARAAEVGRRARKALHDVANRCTSVGVSASIIRDQLRDSALPRLDKLVALLRSNPDPDTVAKAAVFAEGLATRLRAEQSAISAEIAAMGEDLEGVRILAHNYAKD